MLAKGCMMLQRHWQRWLQEACLLAGMHLEHSGVSKV